MFKRVLVFAEGVALTPTDVHTLLVAARQAPGVPPPPDNKYVALPSSFSLFFTDADNQYIRVYKSAFEYVRDFQNAGMDVVESMRT